MDSYPNEIVVFAGDFNANPGVSHLNPSFCCPPNEQGIILARYLNKWDYVSVHLHPSLISTNTVFTYESEAHSSLSIIDHVLCPSFYVHNIQAAFVGDDHPLNTSDHLPLFVRFSFKCLSSGTSNSPHRDHHLPAHSPNWKKCDADTACLVSFFLVLVFWTTLTSSTTLLSIVVCTNII